MQLYYLFFLEGDYFLDIQYVKDIIGNHNIYLKKKLKGFENMFIRTMFAKVHEHFLYTLENVQFFTGLAPDHGSFVRRLI